MNKSKLAWSLQSPTRSGRHLTVSRTVAFPAARARRAEGLDQSKTRDRRAWKWSGLAVTRIRKRGSDRNLRRTATESSAGARHIYTRAMIARRSRCRILLSDGAQRRLRLNARAAQAAEPRCVYVTTDQAEGPGAFRPHRRVNQGKLEHGGRPVEVYAASRTRFVGDFLARTINSQGHDATAGGGKGVRGPERRRTSRVGSGHVTFNGAAPSARARSVPHNARPEDILLLPSGRVAPNMVVGKVDNVALWATISITPRSGGPHAGACGNTSANKYRWDVRPHRIRSNPRHGADLPKSTAQPTAPPSLGRGPPRVLVAELGVCGSSASRMALPITSCWPRSFKFGATCQPG